MVEQQVSQYQKTACSGTALAKKINRE